MNMLKTAAIATAFAASLIARTVLRKASLNLTDRRGPCTQLPDPGQRQHQRHSKRQRAHHQDREDQVRSRQQSEPGRNRCRV